MNQEQPLVDEADRLEQRSQMLRAAERAWLEVLQAKERIVPLLKAYAAELPRGARKRQLHRLARQIDSYTDATYREAGRRIKPEWLPLLLTIARSDRPSLVVLELSSHTWGPWDDARRFVKGLLYPLLIVLAAVLVYGRFQLEKSDIHPWVWSDYRDEQWFIDAFMNATMRHAGIASCAILVVVWSLLRTEQRIGIARWIPLLGRAVRNQTWSRFLADTRRLIQSGVAAVEAIRLAALASTSRQIRRGSLDLMALIEHDQFPPSQIRLHGIPALFGHALIMQDGVTVASSDRLQTMEEIYRVQASHRIRWIAMIAFPVCILLAGFAVLLAFHSISSFTMYFTYLN